MNARVDTPDPDDLLMSAVHLAAIHLDLADELLTAAYPPGIAEHLFPYASAHVLVRRALAQLNALLPVPSRFFPQREKRSKK